jgi:hypothetical protein
MSRRRHWASSATAAAMPLQELEQWLQERAERRPTAPALGCWTDTSLQSSSAPYRSSRSAGSVRRRCRCIQPWRHDGVRGDLHGRTSPQQHRQVVLNRSASLPADPPAQAERRCRRVSVVRGIPCCHCRPGRRWSTLVLGLVSIPQLLAHLQEPGDKNRRVWLICQIAMVVVIQPALT